MMGGGGEESTAFSPCLPTIVSFFCSRFSFRTAESFTLQITKGKTQPKKCQLRRLEVFLHRRQGRSPQAIKTIQMKESRFNVADKVQSKLTNTKEVELI